MSEQSLFSREVLWDLLDLALIVVDEQNFVRNMNMAAERLFGKSGRTVIGDRLDKLLPGYPVALDLIDRSYSLKMPCRLRDAQISPAPGVTLSVSLTAVPLLDEQQKPNGAILQLEEVGAAERLEVDQRLNETLDSLGNMAMAVAHEVKNPLAGIRGAAQLLEMEVESESAVACTDLIRMEVDRISRLLDRLLGLADDPLIQEKEVNIHEVLNHVLQVCEHSLPLPKRDFDPSLPTIRGDRDQLIQLFLNLIQNALEAAGPKGNVILCSRMSGRVRFENGRRRRCLVIEIQDDGPGISKDLIQRIFLPFVTSKHKGTGLGLAISQKIVNEHGGVIEVESDPGRTVFRVFLHVSSL
ncbi:MAG: PAS domain-containing protein [Magnetococcales bacterium]|nr:PAS domain-containing protein [Magnetococcales bacterium]